jgi:ferric-dicitrate binding protein FerR (iron transport regulator)
MKRDFKDNEWSKLAAIFSGEIDPTESDINMMSFDARDLRKSWNDIGKRGNPVEIDTAKAWEKMEMAMEAEGENQKAATKTRLKIGLPLRVAAAIALLAVSVWLALTVVNNGTKTVVADNLNKITVGLPDGGTMVMLNRNSTLTYPSKFKDNTRVVELEGEAFFDVARDETKPFIVKTGIAEIKVLGTSFNVITGKTDNEVEVFVESGKVEVKNLSTDEVLTLEKGIIGVVSDIGSKTMVNTDVNYTAWSTETLIYEGTELREVFEDIKRVYGTDIKVTNDSIYGFPLSTDFNNQPVELVVKIICATFNLDYTEVDNEYILSLK